MNQSRLVYLAAIAPLALAAILGLVGILSAESVGLTRTLMGLVILTAIAGVLIAASALRRTFGVLGAEPGQLLATTGDLFSGKNTAEEGTVGGTLMGRLQHLKTFLTESDSHAIFTTRIQQAVDCANTNIMIADADRKVVYMNHAVTQMLRDAEGEIRKDLPDFSVDTVLNGSIDRFHKDPRYQMQMLDSLRGTHHAQIKLGRNTFGLIANPIFGDDGQRLGTVVEWKDRTLELEAEKLAVDNVRIRQAIDNSTTNLMIANADRDVVYMNKAVENMLRRAEAQIRRGLPDFDVDKILNNSIDRFHKDPSHQMNMLNRLQGTHRAQITIGDQTFGLVANPIFGKDKERLGTVVEWINRTEELKTAEEVTGLVNSAADGNFTTRLATEGKEGFFLQLSEGLNALMETSDRGLNDIARVLGAIAEGDLTERVTADYKGTFLELKDFCNKTTENLSQMIGDIRQASDTILTASSEIASGNADLSSRTEQQASNLEETASSMEELTSTVRTNTDNAKQANVLAEQASGVATEGGELIKQVVVTMESINQSAQKISDIIGVIDGIAFQTNILALNAAVEAARAGEQGRGFAVVASEVRTLAQRSAEAAKDIKQLISDSVGKIEGGNQLVNKSGETMGEIVTAIKRVNDIMSEIAAASVEQASGIEEVNTAVNQMDEMTQQNAALVEEAAAAAESLQSQAEGLETSLSVFRLDKADVVETVRAPLVERKSGSVKTKPADDKPKHATPKATLTASKTQEKPKARSAAQPRGAALANGKRQPKVSPNDAEADWESF